MTATADHYHVIAIQDWGGSDEYQVGWDDKLSDEQARRLADDMIRADTLYWSDHLDVAKSEFGDRYKELISTNVAPGWEAVYIVGCPRQCRWHELADEYWSTWAEPYWSASDQANDADAVEMEM